MSASCITDVTLQYIPIKILKAKFLSGKKIPELSLGEKFVVSDDYLFEPSPEPSFESSILIPAKRPASEVVERSSSGRV